MSTRTTSRPHPSPGRSVAARTAQARTALRRRRLLWAAAVLGVVALIAAMMWSARSTSSASSRIAPDFTLAATDGATVRLSDLRGKNVILYFNEGAGCQSCLYQMVD